MAVHFCKRIFCIVIVMRFQQQQNNEVDNAVLAHHLCFCASQRFESTLRYASAYITATSSANIYKTAQVK